MAENQVTWKPWQVDASKLKESKRAKKRPKQIVGAAGTSEKEIPEAKGQAPREGETETRTTYENEAMPGITTEEPKWKDVGSAESRGPRGYDAGNTNDALFGSRDRGVPAGLRRMAGGGGGGGTGGDDDGTQDGGAGDGDGDGDDDGDGNGPPAAGPSIATPGPSSVARHVESELDYMATWRAKQRKFAEVRKLQLEALCGAESDWKGKLTAMVNGWNAMGENLEAQKLQRSYLNTLQGPIAGSEFPLVGSHREQPGLDKLKAMVTDWKSRGRYDRAARLQAQYIECCSALSGHPFEVAKQFLLEAAAEAKELGCDVPFSSLYHELKERGRVTETTKDAIQLLVGTLVADGNLDDARHFQSLHFRAIEDNEDTSPYSSLRCEWAENLSLYLA